MDIDMNTENKTDIEQQQQQQQQQQQTPPISWKWTGEGCEPPQRSERIKKRKPYIPNDETLVDPYFIKELETSAYSIALNHDEYTWNMLNNSFANKNT